MSELVVVGLSSWIVQDGNYSDFHVGKRCAFALEFYVAEPLIAIEVWQDPTPRHKHKGDANYSVFGRSIFDDLKWTVLDFGLQAYAMKGLGQRFVEGGMFRGQVYLGVDHFSYFERLSKEPSAPPLISDWKVRRIEIQTSPFVEVKPRSFERDPTKLGWRDLTQTDAWRDDSGRAEYLLHCERLSSDYRHRLTATPS